MKERERESIPSDVAYSELINLLSSTSLKREREREKERERERQRERVYLQMWHIQNR